MTEDDTFDVLRRIPVADLVKRNQSLADFIYSQVRMRREIEDKQAEIDKKERRWGWLIGKQEKYWLSDLPTFNEGMVDNAFEGTGWTSKSFLVEVNKELDLLDKKKSTVRGYRRQSMFLFITLAGCLPMLLMQVTFIPMLVKYALDVVIGVLLGQVHLRYIKWRGWRDEDV